MAELLIHGGLFPHHQAVIAFEQSLRAQGVRLLGVTGGYPAENVYLNMIPIVGEIAQSGMLLLGPSPSMHLETYHDQCSHVF